jgi:hypothetical protein
MGSQWESVITRIFITNISLYASPYHIVFTEDDDSKLNNKFNNACWALMQGEYKVPMQVKRIIYL